MKYLQLTLLPAKLLTSLHILPHFSASSKTVLFQVCFGLPLLLAPCGFQSNVSFRCFLRTWLTHRHFLVPICHIAGFSSVVSHSSALRHLMSIILYKHRATNFFNLFVIWVVTCHVSHPFSSTFLTLLLNIQISLIVNLLLFFHTVYNCTKILFAFLFCVWTPLSAAPSAVTALPRDCQCTYIIYIYSITL